MNKYTKDIENKFRELQKEFLYSNPNIKINIQYIGGGGIGLENHQVSSIRIYLSNAIESNSLEIIAGAGKVFGDIEIKDCYISDYMNDIVKMNEDFNKVYTGLLRLTKKKKEQINIENKNKSNKNKLDDIISFGVGGLKPFISRTDYIVLLSDNEDLLFYTNNGIFDKKGTCYDFGIRISINETGYKLQLIGRPTNAIGCDIYFKEFVVGIYNVSNMLSYIEMCSTRDFISHFRNENIGKEVRYVG